MDKNNKSLIITIISIAAVFLVVFIIFGVLIVKKIDGNKSDNNVAQASDTVSETIVKNEVALDDTMDELLNEETSDDATAGDNEVSNLPADYQAMVDKLHEMFKEPKTDHSVWIPIDEATREKLDNLEGDYNNVLWGMEYALRSVPDLVVSTTLCENAGVPYLVVGFTNVGDKPISLDGEINILDDDKVDTASAYPYIGLLGPGVTYITATPCQSAGAPSGDFGYKYLNIDFPMGSVGTYTSSATFAKTSDSAVTASISVENTSDSNVLMGQVTVLLLDEYGMPLANGYVYGSSAVAPGEKMECDVAINILKDDIEKVHSVAIFAAPYKVS